MGSQILSKGFFQGFPEFLGVPKIYPRYLSKGFSPGIFPRDISLTLPWFRRGYSKGFFQGVPQIIFSRDFPQGFFTDITMVIQGLFQGIFIGGFTKIIFSRDFPQICFHRFPGIFLGDFSKGFIQGIVPQKLLSKDFSMISFETFALGIFMRSPRVKNTVG